MSKKEDALKGENKALRLQLNHLSDELVKANQEIMRLSSALDQERHDKQQAQASGAMLKQSNDGLVTDLALRDQIIASLKDEIRRVDARVLDLEAAARDREKEYQRQLAFLRPQAQEAGDAPSVASAHASPGIPPRELHLDGGGHSSDDGGGSSGARGGRRRRGGSASGRRGSTAGGPPPDLLKKCTVLMYNVDSPMMQSQTEHIVQRAKAMGAFVSSVVKLARGYCDAGRAYMNAGEALAEALMGCRFQSWAGEDTPLSLAMFRFGRALQDMQACQSLMHMSMETTFSGPLEQFYNKDVRPLDDAVKVVESARVDWEAALGKFLRAKKASKSALESPAMDAVMSLSRLELSRFDLISRLNLLEMSKRLELIERVCTALYSTRAYFHQCNEVISELEPNMNAMLVSVQAARDTEAEKTKQWDSLRTTLHVDVSTAVASVVSALSGLPTPLPTPSTPMHGADPGYDAHLSLGAYASLGAEQVDPVSLGASPHTPSLGFEDSTVEMGLDTIIGTVNAVVQRVREYEADVETVEGGSGVPIAHTPGGPPPSTDAIATQAGAGASAGALDDIASPAGGVRDVSTVAGQEDARGHVLRDWGSRRAASAPTTAGRVEEEGEAEREQRLGDADDAASEDAEDESSATEASTSTLKLSDFTRGSAPPSATASPAIVPATPPRPPSSAGLSSAAGLATGAGSASAASKPTPLVLERQASSQSSLAPSLTLASAGMQGMKPGEGGIVKAGFLFKQSSGVRKDWKLRWFFVRAGKLYYIRDKKNMAPSQVCNLMLSNVRETVGGVRNSFELRSTGSRVYYLQAPTTLLRAEWVAVLRAQAELQILSASGSSGSLTSPSLLSGFTYDKEAVETLQSMNPCCADCNAPAPDWASLNLGVVICIGCSGVHRSLGVHISKVRSLTLDRLDPVLMAILDQLGNSKVNAVWEAQVAEGWVKPESDASRGDRERWIRAKYEHHGFTDQCAAYDGSSASALGGMMLKAAVEGDLETIMTCLAYKCPLQWVEAGSGATAMHRACEAGQVVTVEFLLQNGASLTATDAAGLTPLQLAEAREQDGVVTWLKKRLREGAK